MELRHLRYFVTVAETLSFSQAARRLHIAQPPLSAQIRSLEAELGLTLFERSPQGVRLTKAGRTLLPDAQEALAAARRTGEAAQLLAAGQSGVLRLGLISPAATPAIAARIRNYHREHPLIALRVRQENAATLRQLLKAGALDLIITRPLDADPKLDQRTLGRHEQLMAMPADHPWAKRTSIPWRLCDGAKVLLIDPAHNTQYGQNFLRQCARVGARPVIDPVAADLATLIWLVSAGLGVCPYPDSLAPTAPPNVVFRPFYPRNRGLELTVQWRNDDRAPALSNFVRELTRPETGLIAAAGARASGARR